jgi:DNA-binding transcriptional ArsR family regulator
MSASSDRSSRAPITACRAHRCAHAARSTDHLSRLATEVIAHRLRTLGHPTRLGLLRALDRRQVGVEQLAEELGEPPRAIAAHLRVLWRAGIVCATCR